jgi:hypothetical protein
VLKEISSNKRVHSTFKRGTEWYPFVESNDVQRFFGNTYSDHWLKYSDKLHDKRDLRHYGEPRILVQQIFWQRLSAQLQHPTEPFLYLNTLFSIFNPRKVSLECLLGLINSKFISATYERRANRLLGDKFPKVSKLDLATIPVPQMSDKLAREIAETAVSLQERWSSLRRGFQDAGTNLLGVDPRASLADFNGFWEMRESRFLNAACGKYKVSSAGKIALIKECYNMAVKAVNNEWHGILSAEQVLENLIKRAYRVSDRLHRAVCNNTPDPSLSWLSRSTR